MKHTPGEWEIVMIERPQRLPYWGIKMGHYELAFFPYTHKYDNKWWTDGSYVSDPEMLANAQLIVAAPDLLEALQYVMVAHGEQLDAAFAMANAAIAKATGESQ